MKKVNYLIVGLVLLIFFVISFITNIIGPLETDVAGSFKLSPSLSAFLSFALFIAYGVMSIPAGMFVEKLKGKKSIIAAFIISGMGSALFVFFPSFPVYLIALFMIGTGLAILQVAINPMLRVAGGEANFAFFSVMAQFIFGLASYVSPLILSFIQENVGVQNPKMTNFITTTLESLVPEGLSWISIYWIFMITCLFMIIVVALVKTPKVELKEDEKTGSLSTIKELLKNKYVRLYFLGIFAYVGSEQGVSYWMKRFYMEMHSVGSIDANSKVALFWGLLTIGCFLGMILLKFMDSKIILRIFTVLSVIFLLTGLFGTKEMALFCLPTVGFFMSVMWSVIFSLALNSVEKHQGAFAGILCTGIAGGGIVQLIVGGIGDAVSIRVGMLFVVVTLGYIFSISFWAKPIINNKTITVGEAINNIKTYLKITKN